MLLTLPYILFPFLVAALPFVVDGKRNFTDGPSPRQYWGNPPPQTPCTPQQTAPDKYPVGPYQGRPDEFKVRGGQVASLGQFPYYVELIISGTGGSFLCGGSIYSQYVIITAAHCVYDNRNQLMTGITIYAGSVDDESGTTISTNIVRPHPDYLRSGLRTGDIALIYTNDAIPFSNVIGNVQLASTSTPINANTPCYVAGFGPTNLDGANQPSADQLNYASIGILDSNQCARAWGSQFVARSMICAGGGPRDACHGDSGGPLVCNVGGTTLLYGAVSYGADCGTSNPKPGVYTSIPFYKNWIDQNAQYYP